VSAKVHDQMHWILETAAGGQYSDEVGRLAATGLRNLAAGEPEFQRLLMSGTHMRAVLAALQRYADSSSKDAEKVIEALFGVLVALMSGNPEVAKAMLESTDDFMDLLRVVVNAGGGSSIVAGSALGCLGLICQQAWQLVTLKDRSKRPVGLGDLLEHVRLAEVVPAVMDAHQDVEWIQERGASVLKWLYLLLAETAAPSVTARLLKVVLSAMQAFPHNRHIWHDGRQVLRRSQVLPSELE